MRVHLLILGCLIIQGCSCGSMATPDSGSDTTLDATLDCNAISPDSWRRIDWSFSDGTSGTTGCAGPTIFYGSTSASGRYTQEVGLALASIDQPGAILGAVPPWPVDCREEGLAILRNYEWVTGATGTVDPSQYSPDFNDAAPIFYVEIGVSPAGTTTCMPLETGIDRVGPRAGRWEITQGGTFGDVIEVHVYDVEYELHDGRIFTVDHGAWRGRVEGPTVYP